MSIIQSFIGTNLTISGSGGAGGTYPEPGSGTYQTAFGSGFGIYGTAYDPGGAVGNVGTASSGWRRVISQGYWCNLYSQSNDNPDLFQNIESETNDAWGGFGDSNVANGYAMEWTGYFRASGNHAYWNFFISSDDVAMFWIGNAAYNPTDGNAYITSNNGNDAPTNSLLLTDGMWYPIRMRYQEWDGGERCQVFAAAGSGNASAMISYFNNNDLLYNGVTGNYGSTNSSLLVLGETTYSGTGYWLDESPALNHAEPYGVTTLPTYLPDEAGGVWQLDGTQYFNIPTMPNYNERALTISIWFNPTSTGQTQNLISKELTFKLRIASGGQISILAGNGYAWSVSEQTNATVTYGAWNNAIVTIDGNATTVYLNGTNPGTYAGVTLGTTGNFPVNIGSHSGGSDNFTGKIGRVKIISGIIDSIVAADEYTTVAPIYGITP